MLGPIRHVCPKIRIGTTLIQRNEDTAEPIHIYDKLPKDIAKRWVLLLDPMLATGGSAAFAIKILLERGVKPCKIVFTNVVPGLAWRSHVNTRA